ncbi:TPA: UMP kinase [Candidatus Dependentiae bacterium]|nr:MAG: Uridylate kinase [candidate division TM6 bacterium GW2011_GWF2_33_332]HBS48111.1 UMP kinase [Candidatus Dependentiae bacterium]HBZ73535.1 UMP kinase [Candidatus Dependentiae bacterium]
MKNKKKILLKVSGEIFSQGSTNKPHIELINQIKKLQKNCSFAIVIGAGNLFRGPIQGKELGLSRCVGDEIGMLATILNSKILQDLLNQNNIESTILSTITCPQYTDQISQQKINDAFKANKIIIFAGGTGNPGFSTDTNGVIRSLQIEADEMWKLTKVDGIFDKDPIKHKNAKLIKSISYDEFLKKNLLVLDQTAIVFAKQNKLKIRVLNFAQKNCLEKALKDSSCGSLIS